MSALENTFGIVTQNNITIDILNNITNITTDPSELIGNINQIIYNGHLFFIILCTFFLIAYKVLQSSKNQPLVHLLQAAGFCSILSFIMRAIEINGYGLITSYHMWIFPIITAILVFILKSIED